MSASNPVAARFSGGEIPKAAKEKAYTGRTSSRHARPKKSDGGNKGNFSGSSSRSSSRGKSMSKGHQTSKGKALSPTELASVGMTMNNKRSNEPKNVKTAAGVNGWIQTKKHGTAAAAVGEHKEGAQAQKVLALGLPSERRPSQLAVTSVPSRAIVGETRVGTQTLLPRREGSSEEDGTGEDTDTELEAEDDDDQEREEQGVGAEKLELMDTQELLANEDISQLERMQSQQQREADRQIKRLVKKALPERQTVVLTPGAFIGAAGVRKRRIARYEQGNLEATVLH